MYAILAPLSGEAGSYRSGRGYAPRQKRTFAETGNDLLSLSEQSRPVIKSRRYPPPLSDAPALQIVPGPPAC